MTKSHFCDSQTVANGFIGNTVVTLGGTLTTFSIAEFSVQYLYMSNTIIMINVCHVILILKAKNI